jgi:uncharacterized protein (DUF4213/DUF364 family)
MEILNDLISTLDTDTLVKDIRQGVFHTAVITRHCGLAATLPRDALKQDSPMVRESGSLLSKSSNELVQLVFSRKILEAAIGMATINSLLEIDQDKCIELNAADLILEKGKKKNVAVVGHFPFLDSVRREAEQLWIIEKNPREGDVPDAEAESYISQADVVGITGTAFTNHTIDRLLTFCNKRAFVVVLGDSAPLSSLLFNYGVDAVSGTLVVDPEAAIRCVSEGANFRQIRDTKKLTMMKK